MITTSNDSLGLKHPSQLTSSEDLPIEATTPFDISPNPAKEIIHVKNQQGDHATFVLFNQLGKIVHQSNSNDFITPISLRGLPKGLYFLEARNRRNRSILKVLLQ